MRIALLLTVSLLFGGCAIFDKPTQLTTPEVQVVTREVPLQILQPELPREITLSNVQWFVITRDNLDEQIAAIEKYQGGDFVVFAITPQSYENMAFNLQEIRRYILQQKEIILYYRDATTVKPEEKPAENKE